ncbi:hypothetical protein MRX96_002440 [Rhipicephalus microplus]
MGFPAQHAIRAVKKAAVRLAAGVFWLGEDAPRKRAGNSSGGRYHTAVQVTYACRGLGEKAHYVIPGRDDGWEGAKMIS